MAFYLTNQSLINLKNKVEEIDHRLKHDVAKEIGKAADLGDLSENAEWEAAIELQRNLQHEVSRLKEKIRTAQIIEELPISGDKVSVGTKVQLYDIDKDEELTYQILGEEESDLPSGIISFNAPLARGLMQKEPGDEVVIKLPGGVRTFEIVEVSKIEFE